MKNLKAASILSVLFALLIILLGGCGEDSISPGNATDNGMSMSVKTDNSADNPTEIIIDEAKALITEVELEQEPSGQEQHLRIEPFVIYFNMNGVLVTVATGNIPTGKYNKIKFKIHKPEDFETPPDPEFKEGTSGNQRYSFIVKGRYNGNSFVYKSRKSANLVVNFPSLINFQQKGNITVVINPVLWFNNGAIIIDPRNPSNENIIDDNLKNSFKRAFKDDDKNGLPDDN